MLMWVVFLIFTGGHAAHLNAPTNKAHLCTAQSCCDAAVAFDRCALGDIESLQNNTVNGSNATHDVESPCYEKTPEVRGNVLVLMYDGTECPWSLGSRIAPTVGRKTTNENRQSSVDAYSGTGSLL